MSGNRPCGRLPLYRRERVHNGHHLSRGTCSGGEDTNCNDDNVCTTDTCSPKSGCVNGPNNDPCSDGSVCTAADTCKQGQCSGEFVDCDDSNPCTSETCDPVQGCVYTPITLPCEDGSLCTVGDTCIESQCQSGTPKVCDDGNGCTQDTCSLENGECSFTPVEIACDDGSDCTQGDLCTNGNCLGNPVDCTDDNPCTLDICDGGAPTAPLPGTATMGIPAQRVRPVWRGIARGSTSVSCDDGDACTEDSCDPVEGCLHLPTTGGGCDDGNPCTEETVCIEGECTSGQSVCECEVDADCPPNEDLCLGETFCNKGVFPFTCGIAPNTQVECAQPDTSGCTTAVCQPETGECVTVLTSETGDPCDDGNACTTGEVCVGTECKWGAAISCEDNNPCTGDACDPALGCIYPSMDAPCDDQNGCTQDDACMNGQCLGTPCESLDLTCIEDVCIDTCYGTKFTCPGISCKDILEQSDKPLSSGTYWLYLPDEPLTPPFEVQCDMVKNGGGWTGITPELAQTFFDSKVIKLEFIELFALDDQGRPYCEDTQGNHTCRYTFDVPFGFTEYYLFNFTSRPTEESTPVEFSPFEYQVTLWNKANDGTLGYTGKDGFGDIGMGPFGSSGPLSTLVSYLVDEVECDQCELPWPGGQAIESFSEEATQFGIIWGEAGAPIEGFYPWWSGTIYVR